MSHGPYAFKKTGFNRALKYARDNVLPVEAVCFGPNGGFTLLTSNANRSRDKTGPDDSKKLKIGHRAAADQSAT